MLKNGIRNFVFSILAIAFLHAFELNAQNKQLIDSLESLLKGIHSQSSRKIGDVPFKYDTATVKVLYQLSKAYSHNNISMALDYAQQSLVLSEQLVYKKGVANAYNLLGVLNKDQGNYKESILFHLKALKESRKLNDQKRISESYNGLGVTNKELGNYADALNYHFASLRIKEKIKDKKGMGISYGNIGIVYKFQKDYKKALIYQRLSLKIKQETNDKEGLAACYSNIGTVYMEQGIIHDALNNHLKALEIRRVLNDKKGIAISLGNIGSIRHRMSDYNGALKTYLEALQIYEVLGDKKGNCLMHQNIALAYIKLKNYEAAYSYMEGGLKLAEQMGSAQLIKGAYEFKTQLDMDAGNYKEAFGNIKQYYKYRDRISNEANTKEIVQAQMQFDFDKKAALEKVTLEKTKLLAKKEMARQKLLRNSFIILFILIMLIAIGIYRSLQLNRKAKALISYQKELVEEKNKEIFASIEYARRLQMAILPTDKVVKEYLVDSFIFYKPKDIIAGDFYWFYPTKNTLDESLILFAVADSTGHGVPGAMVSVVCANALNKAVREFNLQEPGKILDAASDFVRQTFIQSTSDASSDIQDGMDISLCALNLDTLQLAWSGANISLFIVKNASAGTLVSEGIRMEELKPVKQSIGFNANPKPFTTKYMQLAKGDMLYAFTDGYPDQFGGTFEKKLMRKNLKQKLISISTAPVKDQLAIVEQHFFEWKGDNDQVDDVCVIGLRI